VNKSYLEYQFDEPLFFTGKQWDEDAQLYYFNARWYDPETGRFIMEDPVRDGLNWYVYCSNNPVNYVDPTGLEAWAYRTYDEDSGWYNYHFSPDNNVIFASSKELGKIMPFGEKLHDNFFESFGSIHIGDDYTDKTSSLLKDSSNVTFVMSKTSEALQGLNKALGTLGKTLGWVSNGLTIGKRILFYEGKAEPVAIDNVIFALFSEQLSDYHFKSHLEAAYNETREQVVEMINNGDISFSYNKQGQFLEDSLQYDYKQIITIREQIEQDKIRKNDFVENF